jgi:hypothetical protein
MEIYSHFIANSRSSVISNLKANQKLTLVLRRDIFISDKYNHFLPAQKKMLTLFSSKKDKIKDYRKLHSVNSKNAVDLKLLLRSL